MKVEMNEDSDIRVSSVYQNETRTLTMGKPGTLDTCHNNIG